MMTRRTRVRCLGLCAVEAAIGRAVAVHRFAVWTGMHEVHSGWHRQPLG